MATPVAGPLQLLETAADPPQPALGAGILLYVKGNRLYGVTPYGGKVALDVFHGGGTLATMPNNATVATGSTYLATDQDGGTPYKMIAGVWTPAGAPVQAASGQMIAGPVQLTSTVDIKAVGHVVTDIANMTLAIPASSRPVLVRFKTSLINQTGTANPAQKIDAWLLLRDANNNALAVDVKTEVQITAANSVRDSALEIECYLPAPVAAQTLKLSVQTGAAVPALWSSCSIVPGYGAVAGLADNFYAIAV